MEDNLLPPPLSISEDEQDFSHSDEIFSPPPPPLSLSEGSNGESEEDEYVPPPPPLYDDMDDADLFDDDPPIHDVPVSLNELMGRDEVFSSTPKGIQGENDDRADLLDDIVGQLKTLVTTNQDESEDSDNGSDVVPPPLPSSPPPPLPSSPPPMEDQNSFDFMPRELLLQDVPLSDGGLAERVDATKSSLQTSTHLLALELPPPPENDLLPPIDKELLPPTESEFLPPPIDNELPPACDDLLPPNDELPPFDDLLPPDNLPLPEDLLPPPHIDDDSETLTDFDNILPPPDVLPPPMLLPNEEEEQEVELVLPPPLDLLEGGVEADIVPSPSLENLHNAK